LLSTESSSDLAVIAMLMFLRVGQGYDQQRSELAASSV
jgi:hypothetical protein